MQEYRLVTQAGIKPESLSHETQQCDDSAVDANSDADIDEASCCDMTFPQPKRRLLRQHQLQTRRERQAPNPIVLTRDLWIHAMKKEMDLFGLHNIFNLGPRSKVPAGTLILREGYSRSRHTERAEPRRGERKLGGDRWLMRRVLRLSAKMCDGTRRQDPFILKDQQV